MSIKIKRVDLGFLLLFTGLFIFIPVVKKIFFGNFLEDINVLSIVGMAYLIYLGIKNKFIHISCKIFYTLTLVSLTVIFVYVQTAFSPKNFVGSAKYFVGIIYPIIILYMKLDDASFARVFKLFIKIFDILIAVMFVTLIIDLIANNAGLRLLARLSKDQFLNIAAYERLRHGSIFGHYIPTAEMYCIFYLVHIMDMNNTKVKTSKNVFYMLVALIGVACTGGKTAIVVLLAMILIFNAKKIKYLVVGGLVVAAANITGLFDAVLYRFTTTDLTTGRLDMIEFLSGRINFFPLIGNGANSSYELRSINQWTSAAFEFPFLMFSYEYGVIFAVILYIAVFIVPLVILIKKKNYTNVVFLLLMDVLVNTYNGIGLGTDHFTIYMVVAFFLINADRIQAAAFENRRKILEEKAQGERLSVKN